MIVRQLRRATLDAEAVVSSPPRNVPAKDAVVVLPSDRERVPAAADDDVLANDVAAATDRWSGQSEVDARLTRFHDVVVHDEVAAALLEADPIIVSVHSVSTNHVSTAPANQDADPVSTADVAKDLVAVRFHEHAGAILRARDQVSPEQVVGRIEHVDAEAVALEPVAHDLAVMCAEHPETVCLGRDVVASGAAADHTSGRVGQDEAEEGVRR